MKRTFTICGAILLAAVMAAAPFEASLAARGKQGEQEKPAAPTHDMNTCIMADSCRGACTMRSPRA